MKKIILACLLLFPTLAGAEKVTVTAYHYKPQAKMASGHLISNYHYGNVIALSPDLAKKRRFGDRFRLITKDGIYHVTYLDRMPHYHRKKIDLLLSSHKACRQFGAQKGELILIDPIY